ncbi:MAG: hypothetical protein RLP45_05000, partial [Haliea sp.]
KPVDPRIDTPNHATLPRHGRIDRLSQQLINRDLQQIAQLFLLVEWQPVVADNHRLKLTDNLINKLHKLVGIFDATLRDVETQGLALFELQLPDSVQGLFNRRLFIAHERLIGVATENHLVGELLEQSIGRAREFLMLDEQRLGNGSLPKVFPGEMRRYRGAYQSHQQDKRSRETKIEELSFIHDSVSWEIGRLLRARPRTGMFFSR